MYSTPFGLRNNTAGTLNFLPIYPCEGPGVSDATGGLLSVGAVLGIVVGGSVLLCLLAGSFCKRYKKGSTAESPSPDKNSEVPTEVPGKKGAIVSEKIALVRDSPNN